MEAEKHYINRSGWLRAAILGANDGILSTASLIIGVAAASDERMPIVVAGVAGLVAGALSMAAGEYVSVSSQLDIEQADLQREKQALIDVPEIELEELIDIYKKRGLDQNLAKQVAKQLTAHNALEAHARDELGINEISQAKPLQAALSSAGFFVLGGGMPVLLAAMAPLSSMIWLQYLCTILFLGILGAFAARAGGSNMLVAIGRITFWGTLAMASTALIGHLFGISIG